MKKYTRWFSLVLSVLLLFTLSVPMSLTAFADTAPVTLAKWDSFASGKALPDGSFPVTASSASNASTTFKATGAGTSYTYGAGFATPYVSTNNWKANTSYWTTSAFSTAGYQNVTVTSYQAGSSTGPRDWSLQYSLDNTTWTTVNVNSNAMYQVGLANSTSVNWTPGTVNVKLPADAADKPTVYVRWLNTTATSVGGATVGTSGTNRMSDISITGTPLSAGPVSATGVT
ncbi:MAG: hypothetical protein ACXVP5_13200, partial [Tumebacillaceae bacterium]